MKVEFCENADARSAGAGMVDAFLLELGDRRMAPMICVLGDLCRRHSPSLRYRRPDRYRAPASRVLLRCAFITLL